MKDLLIKRWAADRIFINKQILPAAYQERYLSRKLADERMMRVDDKDIDWSILRRFLDCEFPGELRDRQIDNESRKEMSPSSAITTFGEPSAILRFASENLRGNCRQDESDSNSSIKLIRWGIFQQSSEKECQTVRLLNSWTIAKIPNDQPQGLINS
jgi:hypothetical protein